MAQLSSNLREIIRINSRRLQERWFAFQRHQWLTHEAEIALTIQLLRREVLNCLVNAKTGVGEPHCGIANQWWLSSCNVDAKFRRYSNPL